LRRRLSGIAAVALLAACGLTPAVKDDYARNPSAGPIIESPAAVMLPGRDCAGASDLGRAPRTEAEANALEEIQAKAENLPGFLAVLYAQSGPIVVVERPAVEAWTVALIGEQIRVSPSCVDVLLLRAVQETLSDLQLGPGQMASSAYNATEDSVTISSTLAEADMLALIEERYPSAKEALANGTLRLTRVREGSVTRQ
jgi:hypothetical protein